MNSPTKYDSVTTALSEITGGRCLCFRYRLSPQHPFPAALADALVCYLSLLYPPPGPFHEPVPASTIVFAGDSAGANLALSLIQVIQSTVGSKIKFHGKDIDLPLPCGVTMLSAGLDLTLALPSWVSNALLDVIGESWPFLAPNFPACSIWPSNPPRGHLYCDIDMLCHPLVSPATQKSWHGAPPMWFASGQERFADSAKAVAETAARQGVHVWYEEYEEMPHDWPLWSIIAPWSPTDDWMQSKKVMLS